MSPPRPRAMAAARRALGWLAGWVLAAAFYWLLIDSTDLPELVVGSVGAALAATGFELAREQDLAGGGLRARWLAGAWRPLAKAPLDMALVSWSALRAIWSRGRPTGTFRAVPFAAARSARENAARGALAEALGSFAPNTIVVGVDLEHELILAHQLCRRGGREAIDLLDLG